MATFVKAAELGSFAAAAGELGISPQLVAKRVCFLEDRLGARLLARTTRRQSLTEIGRLYRDQCRIVLAEAETAETLADAARLTPRGKLRISAPVTFGTWRLLPMVARYLEAHPDVEIDLVLSDHFVDPVEDDFEVIFRIGPLADSSLRARALAPFRQIACASPRYLQRHSPPETPEDLARHHCLLYARTTGRTITSWRFARDGVVSEVPVSGRLILNSAAALMRAAVASLGVAVMAKDLAADALATGELVAVLPGYELPPRPMHIVFLPDRRPTPKLRSFIDAAVEAFGEMAPRRE